MEELWWVQHKKSVSTVFVLFYCKTRIMDASQLYSSTGDLKQGSTSSNSNGRARKRSRDVETLSLETRKYPRDLLHSFLSTDPITTQNGPKSVIEEEGDDVEIELNLGLSLDGRFGVNKSHKGLIRASSIAGTIPTFREEMSSAPAPALALARTSSLPVETEEEWRKRKETQSLRRMEAKRRRSEKQRNMKENSICNGVSGEERERQQSGVPGKFNPGQAFTRPGSGGLNLNLKGKCGIFGSLQGLLAQQQQQGCSQGSGESHGGGSSGVSELESKTNQGSGSGSCETRSPASTHSTQERGSQEPPTGLSSGAKLVEGPSKQPETSNQKKEQANGGIEDMPCVFTIGDGPNGRKVEGILYKYGKGEEVRIMCVCHGSFFSPTEFVKHAGGRAVENPLKHIVVNPSPSPF